MKRFYDDVDIRHSDHGWQVTLDGRGLKSVKGSAQIVPSEALARLLAEEWDIQGEELDPSQFVRRDMADYAIDVVAPDPGALAEQVVAYGDTDTLLYRADPDEPLYTRQVEVWEPIVNRFETREGFSLTRASGIIHKPQDPETLAALQQKLAALDPFTLASVQTMTSLAASLIVGLSALETAQQADALELWRAACLEEEWQADLWGRDHEAEERRAQREAGFLTAWEFARAASA